MATFQSSIVSVEPIFLDPQQIAAQIIREVFPPCPVREKPKPVYCACGCGNPVRMVDGKPNRYVSNHHLKLVRRRRSHPGKLNANAIEILRDAKAGRVQIYFSRKASRNPGFWALASAIPGIREPDDRRAEFERLKPYLLLSEERTTSKYYVFDVLLAS
jgi:hypothetical protein